MREKNLTVGLLLDYYGELLGERKRDILAMYYNEDFSLAEISQIIGISRQGVRDIIKKAESELLFFEEKLGLMRRFSELREIAERARVSCEEQGITGEPAASIKKLTEMLQ